MQDTSSDIERTTEKQREAIESGQRAVMQSLQLPLEQWMEFQRGATEAMLDGLESGEQIQRRNVELARTAFNDYLDAVAQAATSVTGAARETVESAADTQAQAVQSGSRQLTGSTGGQGAAPPGSTGIQRGTARQGSPGYREGVGVRTPDYTGGEPTPAPQGRGQPSTGGYQQGAGYQQGRTTGQFQQGAGMQPPQYGQQTQQPERPTTQASPPTEYREDPAMQGGGSPQQHRFEGAFDTGQGGGMEFRTETGERQGEFGEPPGKIQ